jgi:hypothetical protein
MTEKRKILCGEHAGKVFPVLAKRMCKGENCTGPWHKLMEHLDSKVVEVLLDLGDGHVNVQPVTNTVEAK